MAETNKDTGSKKQADNQKPAKTGNKPDSPHPVDEKVQEEAAEERKEGGYQ